MTDTTRNEDIFTLTFVYCTNSVVCVRMPHECCYCAVLLMLLLSIAVPSLSLRCVPPRLLDNVLNAHTNPLRSIQTEANTRQTTERALLQICIFSLDAQRTTNEYQFIYISIRTRCDMFIHLYETQIII